MSITDRQFLNQHLPEFRSDVLGDLDYGELCLMFNDCLELGILMNQRFVEFRMAIEADEAIAEKELEQDREADRRDR